MKNKLALFAIFLFFPLITSTETYALSSEDDYLWLEYGEKIKEKDGSLTQKLYIYYGRFPDKKEDVSLEIENLRAFYSLEEKDKKGEEIFYEADIRKVAGKSSIEINSLKTDDVTVLVEGQRSLSMVNYLAKTSFFLFGHSPYERENKPVPSNEINRRFEISTLNEVPYWPQTDNLIKIGLLFDDTQLGEKYFCIFDENGNMVDIKTDEKGYYTYIPPEDKKLNWKGETAFKETLIVAKETRQNTNYVSSYTLKLHRSRFRNCRVVPGIGIFCGTIVGVFLVVVRQRNKFKFDAL